MIEKLLSIIAIQYGFKPCPGLVSCDLVPVAHVTFVGYPLPTFGGNKKRGKSIFKEKCIMGMDVNTYKHFF